MEMSRLWRRITQNGKDDKQINENLISIQLDQYSLRKRRWAKREKSIEMIATTITSEQTKS